MNGQLCGSCDLGLPVLCTCPPVHLPVSDEAFAPAVAGTVCAECSFDDAGNPVEPVAWPCRYASGETPALNE